MKDTFYNFSIVFAKYVKLFQTYCVLVIFQNFKVPKCFICNTNATN